MQDPRILENWKDIASYLGRSVRACARWEAEYGLPVHRLDGSSKARVFAYKDEIDRWLEERLGEHDTGGGGLEGLSTSRAISLKLTPIRILVLAVVLLAVAAVSVTIGPTILRPRSHPSLSSGGQPILAVLDFENKSGDASLDHWRDGLAGLLIASFSQSKFIRVVSGDEMFTILKRLGLTDARRYSSEDINKIAAQSRATYVLSGSFVRPGESFVITAGLQKPGTNETPMTLWLEAKGENDIISKIDELTRRVMAGLDFTAAQIAGDLQKEAGRITTSSPEALKYYVEGQNHLYKYEGRQALECLEKAVEIDPEFAMAYRALAQNCEVQRDIVAARKYLDKARSLSGRLPENERLLLEGQALYWSGDYPKAIAAFEKLLRVYPDDAEGHRLLGWVCESVEDIDRFIEHYEAFFRISKSAGAVWGLGIYYSLKGWYQKAEDLGLSFINEVGDNYRVRELLNRVYLCRRQFDRARAELEKARLLNPKGYGPADFGWIFALQDDLVNAVKAGEKDSEAAWYLWHIALARGRFSEAVELARRDFNNNEWNLNARANVYGALPFVLEKAGRPAEALEAIGLAQKETVQSQEPWLLSLLGIDMTSLALKAKIQAETGSLDEALKTAGSLKALIDKESRPKDLRWIDYLTGLVEMGRKNYPKAIRLLKKAADSLYFENGICHNPHALLFDALARAYYESGDTERARVQYEKITLLTSGRLNHGDLYAKSYYMLGKIAERTGNKVTAREHYQKFLDLWKDADPGLPEVEDAAKRLAGLGGI